MIKNLIFIFIVLCCLNSCGSYSDSVNFSIKESRDKVISELLEMKNENPDFKVYDSDSVVNQKEFKDGVIKDNAYFYHFYFSLDKNTVIMFAINISEDVPKNPTIIRLISVSTAKNQKDWRRLNSEKIDKKEQDAIVQLFEKKVLNHLSVK